jgi:hypothetical protein
MPPILWIVEHEEKPRTRYIAATQAILAREGAHRSERRQQLNLAATITPELLPQNDGDRAGERSRVLEVAGAGFEPATFGL